MGFPRWMRVTVPVLAAAISAAGQEPRYDPATVTTMRAIVAEVRVAGKDSSLPGVHLMVRHESARPDAETLDVYIGPEGFLKEMEFDFHARDRVDLTGSKVKVGNTTFLLAREVRREDSTLYIRDAKGEPAWKASPKN